MCAYISRIQIHISPFPQSAEQNIKVEFVANGRVLMSTVHDTDSLKAVCDLSAAGAPPKEPEPLPTTSPIELKDPIVVPHPTQPSLPQHDFEVNDSNLYSAFSPQSRSSSLASLCTELFSPTPSQVEAVSDTSYSSAGDETCQIFDQQKCSSSYSSSLNLPHASSFPPIEDTTQMPSGHLKGFAPNVFSPSNTNEIAADDSTTSNLYEWANLHMENYSQIPSLQPGPSDYHGGSSTKPQIILETDMSPNDEFMSSSSHSPFQSTGDHQLKKEVRLGAKRMEKLDTLLEMLQTASLPDVAEHNEIVNELQQLCQVGSFHHKRVASGSFSADLEEPGVSSSAAKFAYDLLSWERFRQEEKHLIREEKLSSISASKEVNARMMKARRRRSKTRDWASDGRKGAKMFFDALHNRDTTDRSFALLLLASNVSLDQMLKITPFPALRSSFASRFARIVETRAEEWSMRSGIGYSVLNVAQLVDA